jgi:dihydrofolate reductase
MTNRLSLICAFANNRVIGRGNDLPWNIPEDLEFFRNTTKGKPIIMGRLTYDSILMRRNGKPLPNRTHYVVTSQNLQNLPDTVSIYTQLQSAIDKAKLDFPNTEIFIIGGASIYKQSINLVDRMYLTIIDLDIDGGDAFFPEFNPSDWLETENSPRTEPVPFQFVTYDRK